MPDSHLEAAGVNPARPGGKRRVLPWEVCAVVRTSRTSGVETRRDGCAEVSRGHSIRLAAEKGRTFNQGVSLVEQE